MKTLLAAAIVGISVVPSVQAAEDAQQMCGEKPCALIYRLVDNYTIEFEGKTQTPAGFSEGILLIPSDGHINGMPPEVHDAQFGSTEIAALKGMAKTAREIMDGTAAHTQPQRRGRGSNLPEVDPNYDAPFELHTELTLVPQTCESAHNALLDIAVSNVLLRVGDNNPFAGAGSELSRLQDACGDAADAQLTKLKEQIEAMRSIGATHG